MPAPIYVTGGESYEVLRRTFRWQLPQILNLGVACSDANPKDDLAIIHFGSDDSTREVTFGQLSAYSNRMANALRGLGLERHDRVAIILPQGIETAAAHLGTFKAGMISLPLSVLFGPDAVRARLLDSGPRVVVTNAASLVRLEDVLREVPSIEAILVVDRERDGGPMQRSFWSTLERASSDFAAVPTSLHDPSYILYTSGTTGAPKGVLHPHRVVAANAASRQMMYNVFPQHDDRVWTPADWAWTGGLVTIMLCTLFHGVPVISAPRSGPLDPEWALRLLKRFGVTNGFLPPTLLKKFPELPRVSGLRLRSVTCGGEDLSEATLASIREALGGIHLCSNFGQTEADGLAGCYPSGWPIKPGSVGKVFPGVDLEVRDDDGNLVAPGEIGTIWLKLPNPLAMLAYWRMPEATEKKLGTGWLNTGDLGRFDDDGYLWFVMRSDEMIKSSGYRIGPTEIENCLMLHSSIAACVVVGKPDESRGQIVKAYIQLKPGMPASEALTLDIKDHVRQRLAAYQYPREIEYVDALPLTTSNKIDRGAMRRLTAAEARVK